MIEAVGLGEGGCVCVCVCVCVCGWVGVFRRRTGLS